MLKYRLLCVVSIRCQSYLQVCQQPPLSTLPAIAYIPLGMRSDHVLPHWPATHQNAPAHLSMTLALSDTATHLLDAETQRP